MFVTLSFGNTPTNTEDRHISNGYEHVAYRFKYVGKFGSESET